MGWMWMFLGGSLSFELEGGGLWDMTVEEVMVVGEDRKSVV